jgi:branched-chain amino acid transport system permease protein
MTFELFLTQLLNGVQLGMLLFLLSAGLTLVFGIMGFLNLAHGSFYMLGAYLGVAAWQASDSFALAVAAGVGASLLLGVVIERLVLLRLYERDHLYQVLATLGLILFFNEVVRIVWGPSSLFMAAPQWLAGAVDLFGLSYPAYRLAIVAIGTAVAVATWWLMHHTRVGMLIRAGATDAAMVSALGVNIRRLNTLVFGLGAALAGLAGIMASPILSVQSGMGEPVLILTLVVIVTGGIGSVRGAFLGALIVGMVDTIGRAFLPVLLPHIVPGAAAKTAGPTIASILIYLFMAVVLAIRPRGLFPVKHG